ncbi:MAG: YtxH domain-containing protein, partial [Deltaproteobacteria bacterium]
MSGNRGNIVLAFLAGGAIGAGIALLFAPATGAEMRKRLKEGAHDATDWARNRVGEGVGKVTHL